MISQTTDMIPSDKALSAGEINTDVSYYRGPEVLQKPVKTKAERWLKITVQIFQV